MRDYIVSRFARVLPKKEKFSWQQNWLCDVHYRAMAEELNQELGHADPYAFAFLRKTANWQAIAVEFQVCIEIYRILARVSKFIVNLTGWREKQKHEN